MFRNEFLCLILNFICHRDAGSFSLFTSEKKVRHFGNGLLTRARNYRPRNNYEQAREIQSLYCGQLSWGPESFVMAKASRSSDRSKEYDPIKHNNCNGGRWRIGAHFGGYRLLSQRSNPIGKICVPNEKIILKEEFLIEKSAICKHKELYLACIRIFTMGIIQ